MAGAMVPLHRVCMLLSFLMSPAAGSQILIVSNMEPSHIGEMHYMGQELIQRGHQVYSVIQSNFPESKKQGYREQGINLLEFQVPDNEPVFTNIENEIASIVFSELGSQAVVDKLQADMSPLVLGHCKRMMDDKALHDVIRNLNIDLAIVDGWPFAPCPFLLPHHLGIPFVAQSSGFDPFTARIPALPSFQPMVLFPMSDNMSFSERFEVFAVWVMIGIMGLEATGPDPHNLLATYSDFDSWMALHRQSLLFIFSIDYTAEFPMVTMPNVLLVPGLSTKPAKPLPTEYENIVSKAEHGVIVVSFGSMAGGFPEDIVNKFIGGFKQLTQTVVWRFTGDPKMIKGGVPANVHLSKWLPQNDLLGHNKTKLFITHCGNNGRHEALYHGVPMLAFPLFAEQYHNSHMVAHKGYGKKMDIKTFTSDMLVEAVNDIISNDRYEHNLDKAKKILASRPLTARQTVAYWIEHVIEFGGDHLRSRALDMPGYAYFMLDILAVVCAGGIVCSLVVWKLIKYLVKCVSHKKVKYE